MPEIPENLQPVLAFIRKHQFWLALALIPCVLIPSLLAGQAILHLGVGEQLARVGHLAFGIGQASGQGVGHQRIQRAAASSRP